jgi:hypothetical protein
MLELLLLQLGTNAWVKPRGPGVMRGIADRGDPQDNHATPFEKVMMSRMARASVHVLQQALSTQPWQKQPSLAVCSN